MSFVSLTVLEDGHPEDSLLVEPWSEDIDERLVVLHVENNDVGEETRRATILLTKPQAREVAAYLNEWAKP